MRQPDTQRIAGIFDGMAARYDRQMSGIERVLFRDARAWAVERASGDVVELGVGTGLNLPRYGQDVRHVTGIELSEGMLAIARGRADQGNTVPVDLRQGDVQELDLPDESADTVVSTFTFCTIPDPGAAARQAFRVLRPGGRFVLAEHGPSTLRGGRAIMRVLEPLSVRIGADHMMRDPLPYLRDAGFEVEHVHRGGFVGIAFHVVARKLANG